MFCTNCGAHVPANSNFCGLCGTKTTTPEAAQSGDTINTDAPARTKPETAQFADTSNIEAPARTNPETPARTNPEAVQFGDTNNTDAPARTKPETGQLADMGLKGVFRKPKTTGEARTQVGAGVASCVVITVFSIWLAIVINPMIFVPAVIFGGCAAGLYYNSRAAAVLAMTLWVLNLITALKVIADSHISVLQSGSPDFYDWALGMGIAFCSLGLVAAMRGTFALPKLACPPADHQAIDEVANTQRLTSDFAADQTRTEKKSRRGYGSLIVFIVVGSIVALPVAWFTEMGGGGAFLVTFVVAVAATWIFEKIVYRPPRK